MLLCVVSLEGAGGKLFQRCVSVMYPVRLSFIRHFLEDVCIFCITRSIFSFEENDVMSMNEHLSE